MLMPRNIPALLFKISVSVSDLFLTCFSIMIYLAAIPDCMFMIGVE